MHEDLSARSTATETVSETNRIPVVIDADLVYPAGMRGDLFDGFATVADMIGNGYQSRRDELIRFIDSSVEKGKIVWLDDWSPLNWCKECNVPILSTRCV